MDPNERIGWTEIVIGREYDSRMAGIGQAATNAFLVEEMMSEFSLGEDASLFVPGCGTGQMFDYIMPHQIGNPVFTFLDLSQSLLEMLEERLTILNARYQSNARYTAFVGDIEKGALNTEQGILKPHDGVLTVLLLQHIEWKKGVDSMLMCSPSTMYFIIQEQKGGGHPITRGRILEPSIAKFAEVARGELVPRQELVDYLGEKSYRNLKTYERPVPDAKTMVGLVFEKN